MIATAVMNSFAVFGILWMTGVLAGILTVVIELAVLIHMFRKGQKHETFKGANHL
jgi:hypothetical protein